MFELDGEAIRELLIKRQMTIREFAKVVGVNELTARRIAFRETPRANAKTIGKIVAALGVPYTRLLKGAHSNGDDV